MDSQSQLNSDLNMLNEVSNIEPETRVSLSDRASSYLEGEDRILGNADFDDADFQQLN